MTNTTIKPLTTLTERMKALLLVVAENTTATAKGNEKITVNGLANRGLVEITNVTRDIHSDRNSRAEIFHYAVTDKGLELALEII